jgi:starch phosphorylase
LLEDDVVPLFYERDARGVPRAWVARMRESMARLTPQFSSNRMLREYTEGFYVPLAVRYRERAEHGAQAAIDQQRWHELLARRWSGLRFGTVSAVEADGRYQFNVDVYLDDVPAEVVRVELYADPVDGGDPVRLPLERAGALVGAANGYSYTGSVPAERPLAHYTPRIVPVHASASTPLEETLILWHR